MYRTGGNGIARQVKPPNLWSLSRRPEGRTINYSSAALGPLTSGGSSQRACLGSALWCDFPTRNGWRRTRWSWLVCGGERAGTGLEAREPRISPGFGGQTHSSGAVESSSTPEPHSASTPLTLKLHEAPLPSADTRLVPFGEASIMTDSAQGSSALSLELEVLAMMARPETSAPPALNWGKMVLTSPSDVSKLTIGGSLQATMPQVRGMPTLA
jgi:hypothetical protein